jgi:hypothetical protein
MKYQLFTFILVLFFVGCAKDATKIYDINKQQISLTTINKTAQKQDLEFISNAHNDLFGTPINSQMLSATLYDLAASNDKKLVTDLVIRQMLNRTDLPIPTNISMRNDVDLFVKITYKRFFHREPNPFEALKMQQFIEKEASTTPVMVWYSFLTSDEYRHF